MNDETRPVVSRRLRRLLVVLLCLTALLVLDSVYLSAVTFTQWLMDTLLEDLYYQYAFLIHLVLGTILIVPTFVFIALHFRRAIRRQNHLAIGLGISLAVSIAILFISGIALTRGLPLFELRDSGFREFVYWAHVVVPVLVVWLFILHRLVGPRIRWQSGVWVSGVSIGISLVGVFFLTYQSIQRESAIISFEPSLAKLDSATLLEPEVLAGDDYCATCHADVHAQWQVSAHKLASFNNPAYAFTVSQTRAKVFERDGNVEAARFCAGCHDPIPLFTGLFDDPEFDFVDHWTGQAGITCLTCHSVVEVDSVRGNSDFTIKPPVHYPFAYSQNDLLNWINGLLIKGKPSFHKKTFLKPFHQSAEFCSTCHKVHLPVELNHYKWLRGQNHYDSFLLSGFSGHSITSFYYPPKAIANCNGCHMPEVPSSDFGAMHSEELDTLIVHNHQFPAANTALQHILDLPSDTLEPHRDLLIDSVVVDIFGLREGQSIDAPLSAPIRPTKPHVEPGKSYVIDVVLRSLTVGHKFTEGTADSNEIWLEVRLLSDGELIGSSGSRHDSTGEVDPWSHFVNAYVIDRDGNRIDERNAEDIFVKLYDNQIGPGSAKVVHYAFEVPSDVSGEIEIEATLNFRKFDTTYVRAFQGDAFVENDLPITLISHDNVKLRVGTPENESSYLAQRGKSPSRPPWLRWNDYGIGFLTKPKRGALRQAEHAFAEVSRLGRAEGNINLARVYIEEGRLDEAAKELRIAQERGGYPWSIAWFGGIIDMQNGYLQDAISKFESIVQNEFAEARKRGFDFSMDYRLLNRLALAYFERSKAVQEAATQNTLLNKARTTYQQALSLDPENASAHYGLMQVLDRLGNTSQADFHRSQHAKYRVDDNARDRAIILARQKNAAADHAAEPVVVYDLRQTL